MVYNLRSGRNRKVKGNPPPESDSSDESDIISVTTSDDIKKEVTNKREFKKSTNDKPFKRNKFFMKKKHDKGTGDKYKKDNKKDDKKGADKTDNRKKGNNKGKKTQIVESETSSEESFIEESSTDSDFVPKKKQKFSKQSTIKKSSNFKKSPLEHVIEKLTKQYGKSSKHDEDEPMITMQFIIDDEDDEEDEDYDPDEDDDDDDFDEDDEGLFVFGNSFQKKNPYDIRLPAKELTPELLEYLQKMPQIIGSTPKSGQDIKEFKELKKDKQKMIVQSLKEITDTNGKKEHPYFHILSLPIDAESKRVAIERQLALMDSANSIMGGGNEDAKAQNWMRGFLTIPFGKYNSPPKTASKDPAKYLNYASGMMDKEVYGMNDAKEHILRYIAQLITNPSAVGNCLAFLGPPGTGKTSLIRNGLGKILNRPVHLIALGGNTDSATLEGHGYTYEGSLWGQIADILMRSKCMNPVIVFDELDKVSKTPKGDEIIGILTHMTDNTQNTAFQDKYFGGINIDLSRVLFVFTMNDKTEVNNVLLDRLRVIHTKGYSQKEKRIIGEEYLLPRIVKDYGFGELKISDKAWGFILDERKEDGVRNLKRDLETIVSRLNILNLFLEPVKTDVEENKKQFKKKKGNKKFGNKKTVVSDDNKEDITNIKQSSDVVNDTFTELDTTKKTETEKEVTKDISSTEPSAPAVIESTETTKIEVKTEIKVKNDKVVEKKVEIVLPKGVPQGIKWRKGDILETDDVRILLGNRQQERDIPPYGMYM